METPEWLLPLLEAKFMTIRGIDRDKNNYGFFCFKCMGNPLRKIDLVNHSGHTILQVVKSSHEYAVRVNDMVGRINCDKIHRFQVNNNDIFFLQSKKSQFYNNERVEYGCKICNHPLKKGSEYCSLACKFKKVDEIANKRRKIGVVQLKKVEEIANKRRKIGEVKGRKSRQKRVPIRGISPSKRVGYSNSEIYHDGGCDFCRGQVGGKTTKVEETSFMEL